MLHSTASPTLSSGASRKVRLIWAFAILGAIAGILLMAGRAHADSLGFSLNASAAAGADASDLSVLVLDDTTGAAVMDASVAVTDSLLDDGNGLQRGQTGAQGSWVVKGALSRGPRALTVSKEGYASISIAGLQSPQVTIYLKALPLPAELALGATVLASGEMADWPGVGDGDNVTAGLAFQSLSAMDLLQFSTESFISPLKDTIDVFGSHEIPSNFMIPDQDIPVFFISVHVNKPTYRLPIARGKVAHLAGIQGTIPQSDLVSFAQGGGKLSMGLLNKLTFTHAGLADPVLADHDFSATIAASNNLSPRHTVTPSAPPFAADILVAAATDMDGTRGTLLPTDIKLAASASNPSQIQAVRLNGPDASIGVAHDILTVALADKGRRISGIVTDQAGSRVAPGAYLSVDSLSDSPALPDAVALPTVANGLAASVYEAQGAAIWYVYALPGAGGANVFPSKRLPANLTVTSYSVMQLDFGTGFDGRTVDGQKVMTQLQRFGRASAKIGQTEPKPLY